MIRWLVFIWLLIFLPALAGVQPSYGKRPGEIDVITGQTYGSNMYYYFFAGAKYGKGKENNLFTRTFIDTMESIEGISFRVVEGIYYPSLARNSLWAIFHAQKPLHKGPGHKFMEAAISEIKGSPGDPLKNITLISSSSGSVVAAQAALLLAKNREAYGLGEIHLLLGYSPIYKGSKLYRSLQHEMDSGNIASIIYDDLQGPGDNVTGMAGRTRSEAFFKSLMVLFPLSPDRFFWPPLIHADTRHGHPHHVTAATREKAEEYVNTIFRDRYLTDRLPPEKMP
jgi:hypothetical protein